MRTGILIGGLVVLTLAAGCATRTVPLPTGGTLSVAQRPPSTCPPTVRRTGPDALRLPAASSSTMVPGTPNHAAVCRYGGLDDPQPEQLAKSASLGAGPAGRLATAFNAGRPFPAGLAYSCPADSGAEDLVVFDYADRASTDVVAGVTGCGDESNGERDTMLPGQAAAQLADIVGAPTVALNR